MRNIKTDLISDELMSLINEEDPIEEDISITDDSNNIVAVVISKDAHDFLLKKIEEEEDRIDNQTVKDFKELKE